MQSAKEMAAKRNSCFQKITIKHVIITQESQYSTIWKKDGHVVIK